MGYTGAWLRNAYTDPSAAPAPTADPAHGVTDTVDPHSYAHEAPPLTETGPIGEYPGSEWVVCTSGLVIDQTDYHSHDAGGHDNDQGAARAGYYAGDAPMQFTGERYESVGFSSLPGQTVSPVALQRGLNSLPQNNPDGFEVGRAQVNDFAVQRKFFVGERVHDRRVVTPNTAYRVTNVPAAAKGNLNTSPFDSLARPMTRIFQRPEIRREPPSASADLQTDGTGQAQPTYPSLGSWVVV